MEQLIYTGEEKVRTAAQMRGTAGTSRKNVGIGSTALSKKQIDLKGEDRRRLIAEAAYFRAEQRGFAPGQELEDWLAAEIEIDALLPDETDG